MRLGFKVANRPLPLTVPSALNLTARSSIGLRELRAFYLRASAKSLVSLSNSTQSLSYTRVSHRRLLHRRRYALFTRQHGAMWHASSREWSASEDSPELLYKNKSVTKSSVAKLGALESELPEFYSVYRRAAIPAVGKRPSPRVLGPAMAEESIAGEDALQTVYSSAMHALLMTTLADQLFKITAYAMQDEALLGATQGLESSQPGEPAPAHLGPESGVDAREFIQLYGSGIEALLEDKFFMIRFKPGYHRFFTKIRWDFLAANNLRFKYDQRLTKYLGKYRALSNSAQLRLSALSLETLLVGARLSHTVSGAARLVRSGAAYINGRACLNPKFFVQRGDIVELRAAYSVYAAVRDGYAKRVSLLSAFAGSASTRYAELFADDTQQEGLAEERDFTAHASCRRYSHAVRAYSALHDVSSYLEVDYLTLTAVVVYEPSAVGDYNYLLVRKSAVSYIKMLNWKYIT